MAPKASARAKQPVQRGMGSKSMSLRDKLAGIVRDPKNPKNAQFKEITETTMEQVKKSYAYDWAAKSTQNRRKLHLDEYTAVIKAIVGLDDTQEEPADWEKRLWGADHVEDNIRAYVLWVAQIIQPRSFTSPSIRFNTLAQRRQSMMYWTMQKCKDVSNKDIWNGSNQALHLAFRENATADATTEKAYATKLDLINLIEYVSYAGANAEYSQQMVVAWLMGFLCAVRPGTIGAAKGRPDQYLRWEDIKVKFSADGNLHAIVTFKWLKGFRDERLKPLRFYCSGPLFAEDVLYSLPHRLLALALRRGYVATASSFKELVEGKKVKITWTPEALKRPVVCASTPKGLAVVPDKPASSAALSNYIQRIALDFGLPPGITMYMWRRSAGTNIARAVGADKARGALGHEITTRTFENSYEQGTIAMDVMSIALGRQAQDAASLLEDEDLTVNRIQKAQNNKILWTRDWITNHTEYISHNKQLHSAQEALDANPDNTEAQQEFDEAKRNFKKVNNTLKRQAVIAFQTMELDLVKQKMTVQDLQKRKKDAKAAGEFMRKLQKAADDARAQVEEDQEGLFEPDDEIEMDHLQDVRQGPHAQEMEPDEGDNDDFDDDDEAQIINVRNITVERDEAEEGAQITDATEKKAIDAACRLLVELLVDQKDDDASKTYSCPVCVADETVPEDLPSDLDDPSHQKNQYKNKQYKRSELKKHLENDFHSPKSKWFRLMGSGNVVCPFADECTVSGTAAQVLQHVFRNKDQSDAHLLKAARQGLFARDFDPTELRELGKVEAVGKRGEGMKHKPYEDPAEFDLEAFVPPRNITAQGDVEEDKSATKYTKPVFLPPKAELTESTLWKEHETSIYGSLPDALQQQRAFIGRRADAILRQHNVEQSRENRPGQVGATQTRASNGKGKKSAGTKAHLRSRLDQLGFPWAGGDEGGEEEGGEEGGVGGSVEGVTGGGGERAGGEDGNEEIDDVED